MTRNIFCRYYKCKITEGSLWKETKTLTQNFVGFLPAVGNVAAEFAVSEVVVAVAVRVVAVASAFEGADREVAAINQITIYYWCK